MFKMHMPAWNDRKTSSSSQSLLHLMSLRHRQVRGANLAVTGQNFSLQLHTFHLLLIRTKTCFQLLPEGISFSFPALLVLHYASNYSGRWLEVKGLIPWKSREVHTVLQTQFHFCRTETHDCLHQIWSVTIVGEAAASCPVGMFMEC